MEKLFVAKIAISISEASHAISIESYQKKKKKKAELQKGWISKPWQNQLAASMTAAWQSWEFTCKYPVGLAEPPSIFISWKDCADVKCNSSLLPVSWEKKKESRLVGSRESVQRHKTWGPSREVKQLDSWNCVFCFPFCNLLFPNLYFPNLDL